MNVMNVSTLNLLIINYIIFFSALLVMINFTSAGFNALRQMIELCRAGSVAVTEHRAAWDNQMLGSIIGNVFGDL
jgi:ribulose 1,5-bisphosphate carboxylase large subunit-like protein